MSTTTSSKPLFTRQQLIALLLPLIAEQALSVTIGLADTLMVSSVGEAAVSGVSLVDSFNVLMIQLLSALATGGAVVASQYIGHREPKNAKAAAAQILFIMISLSVVVAAVVAVGRHGILRVGIPAGIENGMFQIGKLSVSSLTSTLGTAAIAANAVAGNITTFLNIPANAVGMAVLTVIGQCLGAGEKEQASHYARRLMLVAYAGAWVMNLSAFFFLNGIALSWFHLSAESAAMAMQVMRWFNVISLFIWPASFTLPNILRAAGDATFTMTVSVFSMWVFRVAFCYLMVLGFHQAHLLSIWGGMFLDWVFRSLFFAIRFSKGSWLEKKVI